MEEIYKEVYFEKYCKTCEFEKTKESEHPCYDCLNDPVNLYSHKPMKYKKKDEG